MRVLLSIKPEYVASILNGSKKFEFRRRIFARRDIRTVVIYCTRPVGRLVGEFDIEEILHLDPQSLWQNTWQASGISRSYFDQYFEGRSSGFALRIGDVRPYSEEIDPNDVIERFVPPQSYMYVSGDGENIGRALQPSLF